MSASCGLECAGNRGQQSGLSLDGLRGKENPIDLRSGG